MTLGRWARRAGETEFISQTVLIVLPGLHRDGRRATMTCRLLSSAASAHRPHQHHHVHASIRPGHFRCISRRFKDATSLHLQGLVDVASRPIVQRNDTADVTSQCGSPRPSRTSRTTWPHAALGVVVERSSDDQPNDTGERSECGEEGREERASSLLMELRTDPAPARVHDGSTTALSRADSFPLAWAGASAVEKRR